MSQENTEMIDSLFPSESMSEIKSTAVNKKTTFKTADIPKLLNDFSKEIVDKHHNSVLNVQNQIIELNTILNQHLEKINNYNVSDVKDSLPQQERNLSPIIDAIETVRLEVNKVQEITNNIPIILNQDHLSNQSNEILATLNNVNYAIQSQVLTQNEKHTHESDDDLAKLINVEINQLQANIGNKQNIQIDQINKIKDDLANIYVKNSSIQKALEEINAHQNQSLIEHKNALDVNKSILTAKIINNEQQLNNNHQSLLVHINEQKLILENLHESLQANIHAIDFKNNQIRKEFDIYISKVIDTLHTQHQKITDQISNLSATTLHENIVSLNSDVNKKFELLNLENEQLKSSLSQIKMFTLIIILVSVVGIVLNFVKL